MIKCKVIAIANQKGGTAKTTTTLNLGIGLAKNGKRVLLVDGKYVIIRICQQLYFSDTLFS